MKFFFNEQFFISSTENGKKKKGLCIHLSIDWKLNTDVSAEWLFSGVFSLSTKRQKSSVNQADTIQNRYFLCTAIYR